MAPKTTLTLRSAAGLLAASLVAASLLAFAATARSVAPGSQTVFTAPARFPSKGYDRYYQKPSADHRSEARPVFTNIIDKEPYAASLYDPLRLPVTPPESDAVYPLPASRTGPSINDTLANITAIISGSADSNCTKCIDALRVGQALVRSNPRAGPQVMIDLCKRYAFASTKNGLTSDEACERMYAPSTLGAQNAQILSYANLSASSQDGQAICANILTYCPTPPATELTDAYLDRWFSKVGGRTPPAARENDRPGKPTAHRRPLKMLHLSDIHLDTRYLVGGEGKCTSGQCCRQDSFNTTRAQSPTPTGQVLNSSSLIQPANYWGEYQCDAPIALLIAGLQAVTPLNGGRDVDFAVYTGDAVTHDATNHISQDFVTMTEQAVFDTMRKFLGKGPVFASLGNHDSSPSDAASANSLPKGHDTLSWNYDYVSKLWESEGWFDHEDAKQIGLHYGGFSTSPRKGLRIISLNTNLWYRRNLWNNLRYGQADPSGMLRWLTDELYAAEKRGEAVYVQGHVYSGWSGSDPGDAPTNLFGIIVERFQHTIREMFWGHSHEDFFNLFYRNNGTSNSSSDAFAHAYIGPSITPLTRVNPSFGIYDIDPETYRVLDHTVYYSQLDTFNSLGKQGHGPVFQRLYSAREAYSNHTASHGSIWPKEAPLNTTFWARTTDEMLARSELVQQFTVYQGRNSSLSPPCVTRECVEAKVCYLRSGTALQGQRCPRGYSSVQGSG